MHDMKNSWKNFFSKNFCRNPQKFLPPCFLSDDNCANVHYARKDTGDDITWNTTRWVGAWRGKALEMSRPTTLPEPWCFLANKYGGVWALARLFDVNVSTIHRWAHGKVALKGPAKRYLEFLLDDDIQPDLEEKETDWNMIFNLEDEDF